MKRVAVVNLDTLQMVWLTLDAEGAMVRACELMFARGWQRSWAVRCV